MTPFDYLKPDTLDAACDAWAGSDGRARLLAGGTDLTVGLRHGAITTELVIDLKDIAELRAGIDVRAGMLRVAAGTTMTQVSAYLHDHQLFPALAAACDVVGSIQIRNRATLAGNICNASPAADTVPVLAALGAEVEITGPDGLRHRPIVDFIQGNRQIDLARGEIVTATLIPLDQATRGCAFDRITRRRGVDLATANLCCTIGDDGAVVFAFGSVAPRPLVVQSTAPELSDLLAEKADRADEIARLCAHARPISDVRASAAYRTAMLQVMAERALAGAKIHLKDMLSHAG